MNLPIPRRLCSAPIGLLASTAATQKIQPRANSGAAPQAAGAARDAVARMAAPSTGWALPASLASSTPLTTP
ncbi:hypothetical protein [Verminephrobacter eiseniae]|uniref:hypothetical protein n=1 Tax=Verminephrobacter eiseniae TaxID=364317 RepID=UPI0016BA919E|nr:hypothetical protein [Verminephrobacter eiseniae]KAB7534311.1 hypothetical protein ET532_028640 [Verminephrobacter sp. Larva24]MCW5296322.1 hypothetical protein [Verminephrobacter eiseniae]